MACPPNYMLKEMFENLSSLLIKNIKQKLIDSNKMLSSNIDPHLKKVVVSENVHRYVYAGTFGQKFLPKEKLNVLQELKTPTFSLQTFDRVGEIFEIGGIKCHKSGDICIITPWSVLIDDIAGSMEFTKGKLVIPIKEKPEVITCFLPCGGLDPETDEIPSWAEDVLITDLFKGFDVKDFPSLQHKGVGKMSALRKQDYTSIASGQVNEGDYIICRGECKLVYAVAEDAFYPPGLRNCVRLKTSFKRNINKQSYSIAKIPTLQGKIMDINKTQLKAHRTVRVMFEKISKENTGTLTVEYQNGCFNSLGFLTHETHIML